MYCITWFMLTSSWKPTTTSQLGLVLDVIKHDVGKIETE